MTRLNASCVPRQSRRTDLCMPLELQAVICPGLSVAIVAQLCYRCSDPYAVYLDSRIDLPEPATWMFGRELLAAGVSAWAGAGDISIYPGADSSETVFIALNGEATTAVLRTSAPLIRGVLRRTEMMVPYDTDQSRRPGAPATGEAGTALSVPEISGAIARC